MAKNAQLAIAAIHRHFQLNATADCIDSEILAS
jgi:hypothetical protein